jgi:hypothetical protein
MMADPHPQQGGLTFAKGKRKPSQGPWARYCTIKDMATTCSLNVSLWLVERYACMRLPKGITVVVVPIAEVLTYLRCAISRWSTSAI